MTASPLDAITFFDADNIILAGFFMCGVKSLPVASAQILPQIYRLCNANPPAYERVCWSRTIVEPTGFEPAILGVKASWVTDYPHGPSVRGKQKNSPIDIERGVFYDTKIFRMIPNLLTIISSRNFVIVNGRVWTILVL